MSALMATFNVIGKMRKKEIRNSLLGVGVLVFVALGFFMKVASLVEYVVGAVLILFGLKAVFDFAFGLPMTTPG